MAAFAALGFASFLLAPGCAASPSPASIRLGQDFTLKVGETAILEGGRLEVGFLAVEADSRCPRDVQCAWEGDATGKVSFGKGEGRRTLRLHTSPRMEEPAGGSDPYRVVLIALNPPPVSAGEPPPSDYVVTLKVESR